METIERKSLLNKSALGFFCVNHVLGCSHGCLYPCYAFSMARSYGRVKDYDDWRRPKLVANAPGLLAKELARAKARPERVRFSLTTDPFMAGWPAVGRMSLELIGMINSARIPVSVLTKGILPAELADRDRFPGDNIYGISLVSLSEDFRARWEPGAAPYAERIRALERLHAHGCRTLVHIEPYPTPNILEQDLWEILEAVGFVEEIYFGGWNYNTRSRKFPERGEFYSAQIEFLERFCGKREIRLRVF